MNILAFIRTLISKFLLVVIFILFAPGIMIAAAIPKKWLFNSRIFFMFGDLLLWFILKASFLPVKVFGLENVTKEPSVFVANHQSRLDMSLVNEVVKSRPHIWMATADIKRMPVYRWLTNFLVLVDVETPMKAMRSLLEAIKLLNGSKLDLVIFPEGAIYNDGVLHDFFSGFAVVAKKTGRPVVPICIQGVEKAYPLKTFLVTRVPITVTVGKPFVYQEHDTEEVFKERVRAWFIETLKA
ncbi:MAG: lysophospholipid acyltransferase family protein [Candidatus Dependentiae bacterium]|nr:lysophospholipid acyltransferase family protein [Candidatus Dependentiae bacterium]